MRLYSEEPSTVGKFNLQAWDDTDEPDYIESLPIIGPIWICVKDCASYWLCRAKGFFIFGNCEKPIDCMCPSFSHLVALGGYLLDEPNNDSKVDDNQIEPNFDSKVDDNLIFDRNV